MKHIANARGTPSSPWAWRKPALVVTILAVVGLARAADVSFRQVFEAASNQDVMVVTVPDTDVLVIEAGNYYTSGKRLVVVAAQARLDGESRIAFYPSDSAPATKPGVGGRGADRAPGANYNCSRSGCRGDDGGTGETGDSGTTGAPGASILFDVKAVQGSGKIFLATAGQAGGKGQTGGKGGTGARGGDGAKRSCGGALGLDTRAGPGDGGPGATGGAGGRGGTGGSGGAGGILTVSADLGVAIKAGQVVPVLTPAQGGRGGDPGEKGDKGGGGGMGGGNSCGGGGSTGPEGADGPPGSEGPVGAEGSAGSLRYWIGNEAFADGVTPKQVVQRLTVEAPALVRDCPNLFQAVAQIRVPDGQTVVGIDPPKLLTSEGITAVTEGPVLQPVVDAAGQYAVSAVFARKVERQVVLNKPADFKLGLLTIPGNIIPPGLTVYFKCPAIKAEFESTIMVVPSASVLGNKLRAK